MAKKEDVKNGTNISFDGGEVINTISLKEEEKKEEVKPIEEVASSGAIAPETVESPIVPESPITTDLNSNTSIDPLSSFETPSYDTNDLEINNEIMQASPVKNDVNIVISSPEEWKKYIDNLYMTKPQKDVREEVERIGGKQAELVGYLVKTLNEVADKHGVTTDIHKKLEQINEVDTGRKSVDDLLENDEYSKVA